MTETYVWPSFRARDARALIDFLVEGFGFEALVVHGDGDTVGHAELAWPLGGRLMLGSARPITDDDPWPQQPGAGATYVVTDDVDGVFERAVARGATAVRKPSDTDYGSRECALRDPEGNLWSFGTYRGEPKPVR